MLTVDILYSGNTSFAGQRRGGGRNSDRDPALFTAAMMSDEELAAIEGLEPEVTGPDWLQVPLGLRPFLKDRTTPLGLKLQKKRIDNFISNLA